MRGASKFLGAAVVAGTVALGSTAVHAAEFFDWLGASNNASFVDTVELNNSNAAAVAAYAAAEQLAGRTVAVRVTEFLNPSTISTAFGGNDIDYAIGDLEYVGNATAFTIMASQITSYGAQFGNYQFYPLNADPTHPSGQSGGTTAGYVGSGATFAAENLYPGSPGFRGPTSGNSTAPNIRSALFNMPLTRFSLVEQKLTQNANTVPAAQKGHIPFVTRFNNWGNDDLNNNPGHMGYDYVFDPNGSQINGQPVANQMLARGDFSAMVAHYRARGADSLITFEPGVIGYTKDTFHQDVVDGWELFDTIDSQGTAKVANLGTNIQINGTLKTIEEAGVVWSGLWDTFGSTDLLSVLLSNLRDDSALVDFAPESVDGSSFELGAEFLVNAGQHLWLQFVRGASPGGGEMWYLLDQPEDLNQLSSAGDGNGFDFDRNDIGIPEPASLGLLGVGLAIMGCRRWRRQ